MLHADITDKISALDIDKDCTDLCNTSGTISLHSNPTRIEKGSAMNIIKSIVSSASNVVHHKSYPAQHTEYTSIFELLGKLLKQ